MKGARLCRGAGCARTRTSIVSDGTCTFTEILKLMSGPLCYARDWCEEAELRLVSRDWVYDRKLMKMPVVGLSQIRETASESRRHEPPASNYRDMGASGLEGVTNSWVTLSQSAVLRSRYRGSWDACFCAEEWTLLSTRVRRTTGSICRLCIDLSSEPLSQTWATSGNMWQAPRPPHCVKQLMLPYEHSRCHLCAHLPVELEDCLGESRTSTRGHSWGRPCKFWKHDS